MRVLVTGATGYIGGKLVKTLCNKDWVDAVVATDIKAPGKAVCGCTFYKRDIRDNMDDIFEKEQIDTVVHAAYVLAPIHDTALMEDINKGGVQNILKASAKAGVKQILHISSTTAYGFHPDNDQPLTEESPLRGNNDFTYAKNKKEIETIIQEFVSQHPETKMVVVRPCFVLGPGLTHPIAEHLKKKFVLLPKNTRPWQFVHEDDLVSVMAMLLEKQVTGIFNVCADGTMTFSEMVSRLGNIKVALPWRIIYTLNNLAWFLRLSFITKFPSAPMRMMVNPWIASNDKLKKETGYRFKYNTRATYEDFAKSV